MNCTTLGIDVAKNIFQLHGVDERGPVVVQGLSKAPHSWHVDLCPSFGVLCRGSAAPFAILGSGSKGRANSLRLALTTTPSPSRS